MIRKLLCWLGYHEFIYTYVWLGGDIETKKYICKHCGKIRL